MRPDIPTTDQRYQVAHDQLKELLRRGRKGLPAWTIPRPAWMSVAQAERLIAYHVQTINERNERQAH